MEVAVTGMVVVEEKESRKVEIIEVMETVADMETEVTILGTKTICTNTSIKDTKAEVVVVLDQVHHSLINSKTFYMAAAVLYLKGEMGLLFGVVVRSKYYKGYVCNFSEDNESRELF